ncbi:RICIN domain-containing protein [Glycomyces sp. A-F 0318]|uniref:RICIN domain-containing protein n=1 Tax=Glycomyces amatae TaxID=2881355 RepID=UPI001E592F75|nr:RICIN domain-containing protein [Glycomyces amatae]MCD0443118.1 RICIN domain-containing protein [Glycomyces amatae]
MTAPPLLTRRRGRALGVLAAALALIASMFTTSTASHAQVEAQSVLVVNANAPIRPVTQVGNGMLYGLSTADKPPVELLMPLNLNTLRQPPPNHDHIPNGETDTIGDTLDIAGNAMAAGADITVDMADSLPGFPYQWFGWNDWLDRVDRMIDDLQARPDITNVTAWEVWNEPDWTWPSSAGSWHDGWERTYERIRAGDATTPIMGPSDSHWNESRMRSFLTAAKASGTVPQVISWHELSGWQGVAQHIRDYRDLEEELNIGPLPISINEYATPDEIDVPSSVNHYIAQFEREGVRDAERAFWYEAGTLNGLLHDNRPTASYWMYQWYAEQSGQIVDVDPTAYNDAVASYDAGAQEVSIVFAGEAGDNTVQVNGIGGLGSQVSATLEYVPGSGRTTPVGGATHVWTRDFQVDGGSVGIPVDDQDYLGAYRLVLTPAQPGGGGDSGELRSVASGKCLDVPESSTTAGTQLALWSCNGQANQRWTATADGELSVYSGQTRMCLDAYENQTTAGTPVIIWPCNGQSNQRWRIGADGSVTGQASGLCLDVEGGSTADGASVLLWTCHGGANQRWSLA